MAYFDILNFPSELKRRTASFLSAQDACKVSETCKSLHSSLSLRFLRNSRILFARGQHFAGHFNTGDEPVAFVHIPCISRRVHSISITCRWRDQGWGNRKGKLWVIGRHRSAPVDDTLPFRGGRVVCESLAAPHTTEQQKLSFLASPMEGEVYQLWYRVGGGGGHQLHMFDGRMHSVIFDDEQGNLSRNYQILQNVGAIGVHPLSSMPPAATRSAFYPQLLLRVSRLLRFELQKRQEEEAPAKNNLIDDHPLASFFQVFHIPVNEGSLLALEEIIQSDLDQQALMQNVDDDDEPEQQDIDALDDDQFFRRGQQRHRHPLFEHVVDIPVDFVDFNMVAAQLVPDPPDLSDPSDDEMDDDEVVHG